jgi:hypothetical protein
MTTTKTILIASLAGSSMAFAPASTSSNIKAAPLHMASSLNPDKPLFDPFNLYGENTKERISGQIRTLEPTLNAVKPVVDPLNIYSNKAEVDENVDMSDALPWLSRPIALNRELAGDVGFDPFNFADSEEKLLWQREAELKHARIAMLAAAGWPLSEVFDKPLAHMLHLKPLLGFGDRVPSVLNGGLAKVSPLYWVGILAIASAIELKALNSDEPNFWDPLGLFPESSGGKKRMELAEVQNGRLAMMAIVGFAVQEFVTKIGVVNQTPIFFHPINEYVEYFTQGSV